MRLIFQLRGEPRAINGSGFSDDDLDSLPPDTVSLELENSSVSDKGIEKIIRLKSLRVLDLDNTRISDMAMEMVARIEALEEIWIEDTEVTDTGLMALTSLPKLSFISTVNSPISDDAVGQFLKIRPDVTIH